MNKLKSYMFSFFLTGIFAAIWTIDHKVSAEWAAPFLIYWYMNWKLFHDKNKD